MAQNQHITTTREDAYRLLAACYYPPTAEFLEENCCKSLATLLQGEVLEAAAYAAEAAVITHGTVETLAVEHARLFMGPFQLVAPPYGSIYLDDAKVVMGESTARVAAFYSACGMQLAADFPELPDHIAVELEFMSWLAYKQREAQSLGEMDEVKRFVKLQLEFLDKFLLPWLEPFTSAIIADGEAPFYRAIAHCTTAFVTADNVALKALENV